MHHPLSACAGCHCCTFQGPLWTTFLAPILGTKLTKNPCVRTETYLVQQLRGALKKCCCIYAFVWTHLRECTNAARTKRKLQCTSAAVELALRIQLYRLPDMNVQLPLVRGGLVHL